MTNYAPMQRHDIDRIASAYALTVTAYVPFEGGQSNTSFLLHTTQGDFVLTMLEGKSWTKAVHFGHLLVLLADHGIPTTRLRLTSMGDVATMYRDTPMMVKHYIAGQVCADLDTTMLWHVGGVMAQLHQVPAPDYLPDEHSYGLTHFPLVIGRQINPAYESWLADRHDDLARTLPAGLPRGLIHGDLFYDNVLFEGRTFNALIDVEEACHYYKAFDLGMGMLGLCTQQRTWAFDKARALVAGYQHVRVLATEEKEALHLFAEYAAVATSYWRFWKYNLDSPSPERRDAHEEMVYLADAIRAVPRSTFMELIF